MEKITRFSIWYFALALLAVVLLHDAWVGARDIAPIPYSQLQTLVKEGKVAGAQGDPQARNEIVALRNDLRTVRAPMSGARRRG